MATLEMAMAFYESDYLGGKRVYLPLNERSRKVLARETSFTKDGKLPK